MIPWQTLQEIARLKEEGELTELGWADANFEVKMSSRVPATAGAEPVAERLAVKGKKPRAADAPPEDWVGIEAPMVGTFYAAPAPDAEPFMQVGDRVSHTTTVCIIEAMKLMNEIEAECKGTVRQICKKDSEPVSKGDVLLYVEPD